MADVITRKEIMINAETIGDVAKWLRTVEAEDVKMSTPLAEPATLIVQIDTPASE